MNKVILWGMLIMPWLSLLLLQKQTIKRFMPVAILASLLVTIIFELGYLYNWWTILEKVTPWDRITSVPLVYGAFLVGTLWIFHFTFSKSFWMYMIANILADCFYSFVVLNILTAIEIYKLDNMGNFGIFLMMISLAVVVYVYQRWQDPVTV